MNLKQTLIELSALCCVAGDENGVWADIARLLEPYGEVTQNLVGSVICKVREPQPGQAHLMLDAHIDEIGMRIAQIDENGFLQVVAIGGVDIRTLPASPVIIHGKKGRIKGVICSTPPHLAGTGEKKFAPVSEIYIDIGHTKEKAGDLVSPGDVVTLIAPPRELLGDKLCGKSLDNRAGCAGLLYALELLEGVQMECGLSVVFSSLEEAGGSGAKTAAHALRPTHAVVVDASFAHTPGADRTKCGEMGGGPMIGNAPILSKEVTQALIAAAKTADIPFQHEILPRSTGTNADHIAISRGGVKTGLVSFPLKYMHTPVECVAISDIENTGRLIAEFVKSFSQGGAGR